ncbi:MAG: hypothetical protein VYB72_11620 [Planctomycetota bacterium]|nr:hypothetical protein [Planctomycetota bacterium]
MDKTPVHWNRGPNKRKIADLECNRLKEIKVDRKCSKPCIADHQLSIARGKQCSADEGFGGISETNAVSDTQG